VAAVRIRISEKEFADFTALPLSQKSEIFDSSADKGSLWRGAVIGLRMGVQGDVTLFYDWKSLPSRLTRR